MLRSSAKKWLLLSHISASVGWFGALAAFLVLSLASILGHSQALINSSLQSMQIVTWYAILPLGFAAFATGLLEATMTEWGFFKYRWVIFKLALSTIAIVVLVQKLKLINFLAAESFAHSLAVSDYLQERVQLTVHAAGGLITLAVIIGISVFKPWGKVSSRSFSELPSIALSRQRKIVIAFLLVALLGLIIHVSGLHQR